MKGQVLLSFDVEEFDMPLEYHFPISPEEQMQVGKAGLDALMPMINHHSVSTTLFTTANFAQYFPDAIREHIHFIIPLLRMNICCNPDKS
jgi:hypothetical protein